MVAFLRLSGLNAATVMPFNNASKLVFNVLQSYFRCAINVICLEVKSWFRGRGLSCKTESF